MADCNQCLLRDTFWLNQLAVGGQGTVAWVGGETNVRRRLLEMGFCNGTCVEMLRRAPLGDPIEFRLRGYCVSLRDEQARHIRVMTA
ncbi:MAG: FeoA family protein [Tepidisphaeraceae bacterium]|jgi:Fe2+ transport system protein FeoA